MKPSKSYLRREMRGYLVTVPDAAEQELALARGKRRDKNNRSAVLELHGKAAIASNRSPQPGKVDRVALLGQVVVALIIEDERQEEQPQSPVSVSLEDTNRELIKEALERSGGNRKVAAAQLGISERTLYRKIKEYGL